MELCQKNAIIELRKNLLKFISRKQSQLHGVLLTFQRKSPLQFLKATLLLKSFVSTNGHPVQRGTMIIFLV